MTTGNSSPGSELGSVEAPARAGSQREVVGIFQMVLAHEREALEVVTRRLQTESGTIAKACDTLLGAGKRRQRERRVIVSGIGKAGLIARKVAATLSCTGTAAVFLHPVEALHGDLGLVQPNDSGLLFSYSGETVEVLRLAHELRRLDCPFVAITRSRNSTLGGLAAACLETGEVPEACFLGLAPTSSTTVMLAIGDALAVAVAKGKGFRPQDFARNHPAGLLGMRFRSVHESMRTGRRLVCVAPNCALKEVVKSVSDAKTGAAVLVRPDGTLFGIFTDGDLRRACLCGGDILAQEVQRFASIPCHSIAASASVADALEVFHNTRVEDLPVVDPQAGVVLGLLCLKDIASF